jgi:hypothetical protein
MTTNMATLAARNRQERIRRTAITIQDNAATLRDLVTAAREANDHDALGYASWTAYLVDTLEPLHLDRDRRREMVELLAKEGVSARAIAPIVGASDWTVRQEAAGARNLAPVVTGLDGKTYPRRRREPPPTYYAPAEPAPAARPGVNEWSRKVQDVSAEIPLHALTDDEVKEVHGAATYLRDYCQQELERRGHDGH